MYNNLKYYTKIENKFQIFNKTGQRGIPTKSFGTLGQQVEKRYCPGQNGTSGHFILRNPEVHYRPHIRFLCCL